MKRGFRSSSNLVFGYYRGNQQFPPNLSRDEPQWQTIKRAVSHQKTARPKLTIFTTAAVHQKGARPANGVFTPRPTAHRSPRNFSGITPIYKRGVTPEVKTRVETGAQAVTVDRRFLRTRRAFGSCRTAQDKVERLEERRAKMVACLN